MTGTQMAGAIHGPDGYPDVVVVEEGMREGLQIEDAGSRWTTRCGCWTRSRRRG